VVIRRRAALGLATAGLGRAGARPGPWPQAQPIRFVVPFGPGGTTDIIARILAGEMSRRLGQSVVVENRPGAGATLGTGQVARAEPDGYTLVLSVISAMVVGKVPGRRPHPVGPGPGLRARRHGDEHALPHPRAARPADPHAGRPRGRGAAAAGAVQLRHLRHRLHAAPGHAALPGRRRRHRHDARALPGRRASGHGRRGRRAADDGGQPDGGQRQHPKRAPAPAGAHLAGARPAFPDIPTFRELGFRDLVVDGWSGIAAPARTPRPVLERLAAVVRETLEAPEVVRRYAETATAPGRLFLEDAQRFVREELAVWAPIVRASGATVD
jgi:hypothetical protein